MPAVLESRKIEMSLGRKKPRLMRGPFSARLSNRLGDWRAGNKKQTDQTGAADPLIGENKLHFSSFLEVLFRDLP
jgi:hypothetical protein